MLILVYCTAIALNLGCEVITYLGGNAQSRDQPYMAVSTADGGAAAGPTTTLATPAPTTFMGHLQSKYVRDMLTHIIKFGTVMMFYVYTSSTGAMEGDRVYNRDFFWGLMLIILLAGFLTIRKVSAKQCGVVINRDQTEEWKGWMQVIFLAYHYFHAGTDVYNLIRVLIAAYVWMTGFGHFIYFYKTKQYDIVRVVRTLLRLNFLVICTVLATDNHYMLYYICPMHTFWFFVVFVVMYVGREHNYKRGVIPFKFAVSFALITLLYQWDSTFNLVFWPLRPLLAYNDGHHADLMYEWRFRTGLDHYATWVGMVCGYVLPRYQQLLDDLEKMPTVRQWTYKMTITGLLTAMLWSWYTHIYLLPKIEYNAVHAYYFFIPVAWFLWIRNISYTLRCYYLHMFAWWGRVTLESYISQLHILLTANAKKVLVLFPDYPVLTMVVCSVFFACCSKVLFNGTVAFSLMLTPANNRLLLRNGLVMAIAVGAFYSVAAVIHMATVVS